MKRIDSHLACRQVGAENDECSGCEASSLARTYCLVILLRSDRRIQIGRLGEFSFPAGTYFYTGSARRNLIARVVRHSAKVKRPHWHIDYLLQLPEAEIAEVRLFEEEECVINQSMEGTILISGFGASDCRNRCGSHLKYRGPER